jgi:UDP-N-acetylmuramate dehydrogenase
MEENIHNVSKIVVDIRTQKLPDPKVLGNAGSFFKNPIINRLEFEELAKLYPDMPSYKVSNSDYVKIPAGWLIEACGWKGKVIGNTGCYKNQALVIVNHGEAQGKEILDFSNSVIKSVKEKFGITLNREVNVVN